MAGEAPLKISQEMEIPLSTVTDALQQQQDSELSDLSTMQRDGLVAMETARLDALQSAFWDSAVTYRDLKSAEFVLKVIAQRSKLQKLEDLDPESNRQQVLIIGGQQAEYLQNLKKLAGGSQ